MNIFVGQSYLRFVVNTGVALDAAANLRIYYRKPSDEGGFWSGTASGENIVYDVQNNDLDEVGIWRMQSYAEIGGRIAWGEVFRVKIASTV